MAIDIKINSPETKEISRPKIKVDFKDNTIQEFNFKLELRRALNGDLMIFDHNDIDIIILLEKKKIVAFAKNMMSEVVYGAENRLFNHLKKKGIVSYDSIQGGNVYGSLEGKILNSEDIDPIKASLYEISEWMNGERPSMEAMEMFDDMMDDELLDPDAENSTELGEVPHEEEKGSITSRNLFAPYLYGRYTY